MIPNAHVTIEYVDDYPVAVITFDERVDVLSSCVSNGGLWETDTIMIMQVEPMYDHDDPQVDIDHIIDVLRLPKDTVSFMTAAEVDRVISDITTSYGGHEARAIATAGLSNQVVAGDVIDDFTERFRISSERRDRLMHAGTINIVGISDVLFTDAAKVNSVIAMTEAKTAALHDIGFKETGTTSDAIAIVCPKDGDITNYAGTGSDIGIALARSVRDAVRRCLIKRGDFPYDMDEDDCNDLMERYT